MLIFFKNLVSQYSLLIRVLSSTLCFLNPPDRYSHDPLWSIVDSQDTGDPSLSQIFYHLLKQCYFYFDHYGLDSLLRCGEVGKKIQLPSFYTFLVYSLLNNLLLLVYCLTQLALRKQLSFSFMTDSFATSDMIIAPGQK